MAGGDRQDDKRPCAKSGACNTHILRDADGAEMKIYLIRHGRTEANEKRLYCGSTDLPLSKSGVELIKKCAIKYPKAQDYYTSGMLRADQTLKLLYGEIPFMSVSELKEMNFGDFEMRAYEELKNDPHYQEWIAGDNFQKACPNGESGAQMALRVLTAFEEIARKGRDAVIVTHGGVIAAIMQEMFPNEGKNRYEWQPKPGGGYIVDIAKKHYSVI